MTALFEFIEILAIISYSILGCICVFSFVKSFKRRELAVTSRLFHSFIFLFVTFRIVWYTLKLVYGETSFTFVFNNMSFIFYMSGLIVLVFYWMETYYRTYFSSAEFTSSSALKTGYIVANVIMYTVQFILIIVFYTSNHAKKEGSKVYLVNTLYQVLLSALIGLLFVVIMVQTYAKYKSIDKDIGSGELKNQLRKMLLLSATFCLCFLIRIVIFLYNPITGEYMNQELFITMGYFIPDIIPTLMQLYIWHQKMQATDDSAEFVNNLYENEMDEETPPTRPIIAGISNGNGNGNGNDLYEQSSSIGAVITSKSERSPLFPRYDNY
ncbi:hypothetical protein SAMD00019534_104800 [Acytostelium subglobosum LB1]|uniref:hypothetical protein n=1 Tax=Acytostelium subglobosum LB1 TaxID=1410327 RepID=UPI000644C870|nr:hypothetical protein SAMD00019534_104800 [Acytostelium subglobosum LB1]GAM27305.1 hypothetical protein SAMD00019534_104800 [Acytostelium subglobosum LB1]|eukprot:XP_012749772.1 hypothetical protein SAMD00019534_104800 [Acytostelium subglobosum LB1]